MSKRTLLSILLAAALLLVPASAGAATVANTNDAGPGSLRQAIVDAAPGETITIPAGTYTLTSGELAIAKSLTLSGEGPAATVIRSGGAFRVFHLTGVANEVTFTDLAIRDGLAAFATTSEGGGILSEQASLTLRRVLVADNEANPTNPMVLTLGGGLSVVGAAATKVGIFDSTFSGNVANGSGGPGQAGALTEGGGIHANGATVTIANSTFTGNLSDGSGGDDPTAPPNTQNASITAGGGVELRSPLPGTSISNSTFVGNVADSSGGPGSASSIGEGGGLQIRAEGMSSVTLSQITVTGNSIRHSTPSIASGGGARLRTAGPGTVAILSSTFAGNTVPSGGGINQSGGNIAWEKGATIANSVITGGSGTNGANCSQPLAAASLGFNLESSDECGFAAPGDRVNTDPQLGPLQDNGGPTATMLPAPTSPLLDQGSARGLTADQRGLPRTVDFTSLPNAVVAGADGTDIGAVELQPTTTVALGRLTRNRKRGTAALTVSLPALNLGTVTLSGKGLKTQTVALTGPGTELTIPVVTVGKVKKALRKRGKRKVGITVTYAATPALIASATRKATLVRKKPKPKPKKSRK